MACPKCRSKDFMFIEKIVEEEWRHVVDGVPEDKTTYIIPTGSIGARCICETCGHNWRPRKYATLHGLQDYAASGQNYE